ncbi:MAG: ketoacyl-ACP synthase III [Spirochaetota bacterium]|nr:ketoacyl-ACP synthase III [Spirochaetota bacterium]
MAKSINGYPVRISGIGIAIPEHIITNDDLSKIIDTNDEWITTRTGIRERHVVSGDEGATSLSAKAAKEAIEYAGLTPPDIDIIICATSIPDNLYPSTACEVQGQIGAKNAIAFNVVAACSGFVYAMKIVHAFITNGTYKRALIIGADIHSRAIDWTDRSTCILFGDAAGAMVLEKSEGENEIYNINLYSDGTKSGDLYLPVNGKNSPLVKANTEKKQFVFMNGKEIYKFSVRIIPDAILKTLKEIDLDINKLDYLIPHQANIRIIEALAEKLNLRDEQLIANLQMFGNTSSASIPVALYNAIKDKKVKVPSNIAMVGFGSGLTWGVAVVKWTAKDKRL